MIQYISQEIDSTFRATLGAKVSNYHYDRKNKKHVIRTPHPSIIKQQQHNIINKMMIIKSTKK